MLVLGEICTELEPPPWRNSQSHAFPIEYILWGTLESLLSRREREIERDEPQSMKD
jgi:hypothetical protein